MASIIRYPQAAGSIGTGTAWTNPTYILTENGICGTVNLTSYAYSCYLFGRQGNVTIPSNATVNGIIVEVKRNAPSYGIRDYSVSLYYGGLAGTAKTVASNVPYALTWISFGSATDLWGLTTAQLAPSLVNDMNFGACYKAMAYQSGTFACNVDCIRMTVYYTLPNKGSFFQIM
ncbi:MAG: hypothetical protein NTZ33_06450 [Bacteroidetes bacterium]|nr:hypothetical protein [Bacteroidota bacterium]